MFSETSALGGTETSSTTHKNLILLDEFCTCLPPSPPSDGYSPLQPCSALPMGKVWSEASMQPNVLLMPSLGTTNRKPRTMPFLKHHYESTLYVAHLKQPAPRSVTASERKAGGLSMWLRLTVSGGGGMRTKSHGNFQNVHSYAWYARFIRAWLGATRTSRIDRQHQHRFYFS